MQQLVTALLERSSPVFVIAHNLYVACFTENWTTLGGAEYFRHDTLKSAQCRYRQAVGALTQH